MKTNQSRKNNKWLEKELGEVATFFNGKAHENDISDNGKYVVVNSKFVSTNGSVAKYTDTCLSPLKKGDVAMVMSDIPNGKAIAKCFLVKENNKYTLNQRIGGFRSSEINGSFLYFLLNRNKYFLAFDDGVNQTNLRKDDILECPLNYPCLPEQNRIVDILETWDNSIEKLTKKIELKKQIKYSLMYDLLNGKKRLVGFINKWETIKLEDVAMFRRGSFPQPYGLDKWYDDANGIPFVQVYDVDNNFRLKRITKRKISTAAQEMSVYIPAGSIVLTIQGSIGRIAITDYDAYLDRTLLFFQTFKKPINKVFFMYSVFLLFEIEKNKADGGTIKTITKETLNKFNIKITSLEEQSAISEILTTADKEIQQLEKKLVILKDQKRYLLNNLITGTIRTPETLSTKLTK